MHAPEAGKLLEKIIQNGLRTKWPSTIGSLENGLQEDFLSFTTLVFFEMFLVDYCGNKCMKG